jgi:hypothetical protein
MEKNARCKRRQEEAVQKKRASSREGRRRTRDGSRDQDRCNASRSDRGSRHGRDRIASRSDEENMDADSSRSRSRERDYDSEEELERAREVAEEGARLNKRREEQRCAEEAAARAEAERIASNVRPRVRNAQLRILPQQAPDRLRMTLTGCPMPSCIGSTTGRTTRD